MLNASVSVEGLASAIAHSGSPNSGMMCKVSKVFPRDVGATDLDHARGQRDNGRLMESHDDS